MRKANRMIHQMIEPFQPSFLEGYTSSSEKSALLARLRWAFIIVQLLLIFPAIQMEYLLVDWVPYYLGINAALILFNLAAPRIPSLFLQLSIDLLSLCTLLVLTAGCHNPFSSLVFVSAILGPMFLSRTESAFYLTLTAAGLTKVCLYREPVLFDAVGHEVSPYITIAAKVLVLFMLGGMTLWLKACLEHSQMRFEKLNRQKQRLNNFRAVGVVAGQLSHELSTPLNTLKLMIDKLERKGIGTESPELRIAKSALNQCENTVRNLFDCGVDADSLSFKDTDVGEFIRTICAKWQTDFPGVKLALELDSSVSDLHYRLPVNPFAQALMDLLDNAMDASEGVDEPEISVTAFSEGDAWKISILDKGAGLDQSVMDRLGQAFVSTKNNGTGLGLYNAQSLLEALGGSLGFFPRSGGGTRVQMVLPL